MDQKPIDKARELILSLSADVDAEEMIKEIEAVSDSERASKLAALYGTAIDKASGGDVKGISVMLRVFEHFGDRSHDRMLLHYIAQAAANNALTLLQNEKSGESHHAELQQALELIAAAFADANELNKQSGIS
jgi:hypothetical protein